mmetsp:Transcript_17778/g.49288  ORF Transcript_17778/g.49288 Transcript_17778/m.49288 type:complete len:425 (-) Transcript_17778:148-1422(-)
MGCGISSKTTCDLESTTPRQGVSSALQRKVRNKMRVEEEDDSDHEQDASLPKEVMGRELASFMRENAPRDHQFLSQERSMWKPAWSKRVQREWRILARGLPEDIHLRLYGDRMDIMRAALVGPKNTPYADALMFFDVHLASNYPLVPPSVKFWSFGERLNPNLYESGLVCLSLLGTWSGSGTEVWCPRKSTVLQVLVSILGLVLVEEPYFNEPGYERTRGTTQADILARQYSEKARLMSLRSMLRICQNPPSGFEDFTKQHFVDKGEAILKRVEQFVPSNTTSVATPSVCSKASATVPRPLGKKVDGIDTLVASEGFRREVAKMLPGLKGMQQRMAAEHRAALLAASSPAAGGGNGIGQENFRASATVSTAHGGTGAPVGGLLAAKTQLLATLRSDDVDKDKSRAAIDLAERPHVVNSTFAVAA